MARQTATVERPAGLLYREEILDIVEERALIEEIERLAFDEVCFRGVVAKRAVRHFGYGYDFAARSVDRTEEMPGWLQDVRARAAVVAERDPADFVEALVTRYPPGAGIGWHRDAPAFGSTVVGVSLLAPCRMRFRRTVKLGSFAFDLRLEPRSVYVLSGAARASWQHSIPPVDHERYSITFRTIRRR